MVHDAVDRNSCAAADIPTPICFRGTSACEGHSPEERAPTYLGFWLGVERHHSLTRIQPHFNIVDFLMQVVKVAQALVDDEAAVLEAEESRCSAEAKLLKGTAPSVLWAPDKRRDTCRAFRAAPRFVLLDFRHVLVLPVLRQPLSL